MAFVGVYTKMKRFSLNFFSCNRKIRLDTADSAVKRTVIASGLAFTIISSTSVGRNANKCAMRFANKSALARSLGASHVATRDVADGSYIGKVVETTRSDEKSVVSTRFP